MEIVDMPDRRASLLVRLILQNDGTLAQNKREHFSEINDDELTSIEAAVRELMGSVSAQRGEGESDPARPLR